MKEPDFILVGESRCGSTSLYETLIQHPQIILPTSVDSFRYENGTIDLTQKELRFFDRNWDKGPNWYFERFKNIPQTISGDASATYLYHDQALQRIKSLTPTVKILILLRNPTHRFISHFYHLSKINEEFKSANPDIEEFARRCLKQPHHILERGIYHRTVENCLNLFNLPQVLIIESEKMFSNPQVLYQIHNFLEIEPHIYEIKHLRQSNAPKTSLPEVDKFYEKHNKKLCKLLRRDFSWVS